MSDAYIWLAPGRHGGLPCIGGTRIRPETVGNLYLGGDEPDALCQMYHLTRPQLLTAFWFLAVWGSRRWRTRWTDWAREAQTTLAYRDRAAATPDPPR